MWPRLRIRVGEQNERGKRRDEEEETPEDEKKEQGDSDEEQDKKRAKMDEEGMCQYPLPDDT